MAAVDERAPVALNPAAPALLRFLSDMWAIPSVMRVAFGTESVPPGAHLWVFFSHDDREGFEQAVMAERAFRQDADTDVLYIHFFTIDEIKDDLLPQLVTVFSR